MSNKFLVSSHKLMFREIELSSADMERGVTLPYHKA